MKTNLQLVLLVAFVLATGVLGTLLVQSHSAEAQTRSQGFRECFFIARAGAAHASSRGAVRGVGRFPIPPGWTVVGAGGGGGRGRSFVALCR